MQVFSCVPCGTPFMGRLVSRGWNPGLSSTVPAGLFYLLIWYFIHTVCLWKSDKITFLKNNFLPIKYGGNTCFLKNYGISVKKDKKISQLSHNFVKMAYFYKIMCVKKSAFKKVILSDFFKNTSLSCFGQPSGESPKRILLFSLPSPPHFFLLCSQTLS